MKKLKHPIHTCALILLAVLPQAYAQQSILGSNLIVNGNAEAGSAGTGVTNLVSSIPGWTKGTGSVNVVSYDIKGLIPSTSPAPPDHGFQYFVNGSASTTGTLTQSINVSSATSTIAGGNVKYTVSGYLGAANGDVSTAATTMAAVFQNASGQTLATVTLGPIGFSGNALFLQQQIGLVPVGTTTVAITLTLTSPGNGYGAADSLSLVLGTLGTSAGAVLGTNLVVNGNAEAGTGAKLPALAPYIPGWSVTDGASVAPYGGTSWISTTDPGPVDEGMNAFCSATASATIYQDIDVSAAAPLIDAGQVTYQISAWLGGYLDFGTPTMTYTFYDWTGKQLGNTEPLTSKHSTSGLSEVSNADTFPAGARRVHIVLSFPTNSAADDINFLLSAPSGPPVIDPGGIVSASAFGGGTTVGQGSWIEIYGRNLASTTYGWQGSDFNNGVGPTTLQGVTVTIAGEPAYVDYVSPGQVDALLPSDATTGPVPIIVSNANGTSDPFSVEVNQTLPSLLAPSTFLIGSKQYVAAFNPDGSFALPQNALVGVASNPATPGQTLVMYGVGFGPVSDGVTAGTLATAQDSLMLPLVVMFGATKAQLAYAGLASGYTGLYQINVVVPQLAANAAEPITFTLGTTKSSQTLYIAVQ